MAATEATLGEQIEARWGRFLDLWSRRPRSTGGPELREKLWLYVELFVELTRVKIFLRGRRKGWTLAMLGFEALAVDGPNPVESRSPEEGRPAKEGKEKGRRRRRRQDGAAGRRARVPPTAPSKGASFSVQEHIEMTKKKEQSVKKALESTCRSGRGRGAGDVDEKKQKLSLATPLDELKEEYEEIQRELSTRGSLEAARLFLIAGMHSLEHLNKAYDPIGLKLDGLGQATLSSMDQVQPILEELVIKYSRYVTLGPEARLGMALVQTVLAVHAANANPEVMKEVTEAAASTAAEPKAVGGKFNGL
eukprot:tig00020938_g16161.t1